MKFRLVAAVATVFLISGCASQWSTVDRSGDSAEAVQFKKVPADKILVVQGDIADRKYVPLGDISATVNKMTIFHADPTREDVNRKLREEAEKVGADAVIFVRYGTVGVSAFSWGSLNGKGRAISFVP